MKSCGVEWIGEIPDNWKLIRLKDICINKKDIAGEKSSEYERLALTLNGVIKRPKDDQDGLQPKEFDSYQILEENDFVFKMIDLQNISTSRVGLSPYTGLVSPAYIRFAPKKKGQFNGFIYYYLMLLWHNCVFNNIAGDGVRSALNATDMGNLKCPFPLEEEQHKIVSFLKLKIDEIDSLIEVENKQIDKLNEYRNSIINDAVTKGLDKNASMKNSNVNWIGMIPENWEVKKAKFITEEFCKGNGIKKEDIVIDGDTPCLRYGEIYSKYNNFFINCVTRTNLANVSSPIYFSKGDLLFACTGELVEEIGKNIMYRGEEKCLAGGDVIVMKHNQHPGFINYAMNSINSQMQKSYGKAKLKVVHISSSGIGNVQICIPPIEEQKSISDYLDILNDSIDKVILIKNQKIKKLGEYKKSLIYEYITGKKEVI